MHPDDKAKLTGAVFFGIPAAAWLLAVFQTQPQTNPKIHGILAAAQSTPQKPLLIAALIGGFILAGLTVWAINRLGRGEFQGAPFRRFLRGTRMVSPAELKRRTTERKRQQVTVAGIPMPTDIENRHLLIVGSPGSGKSVLMRELAYTALKRGDRIIVADPNGDMYSKFGRKNDLVLNPYDQRSQGWSFFNELRTDYDYKRLALSIVPKGKTADAEEWNSYARLLLAEAAKKLGAAECETVRKLFEITNIMDPDDLKDFLAGTDAESLFVGADRALASARFVLSNKLPPHLSMPAGDFSLRDWLENEKAGNLFITWREDMAVALRPLISAWIDTLCSSILSFTENQQRRIWMFLDELASLEKQAHLIDAATKGRKFGLRIVAGLQSTAQLEDIYGVSEAQILRSCFRSLIVLGGAITDPKTREDMSLSLGEHEVERDSYSKTRTSKGASTSKSLQRTRERVVTPAEIAALPDLCGYIAFAGDLPISRTNIGILKFKEKNPAFEERISNA